MKVIMADMPATVKAYTILKDGFYTIVLNSRLSIEQNRESYRHELIHIYGDDFYKYDDVDKIEGDAHGQG